MARGWREAANQAIPGSDIRAVLGAHGVPPLRHSAHDLWGDGMRDANASADDTTEYERRLVRLMVQGHTDQQIAGILYIGVRTMQRHLAELMRRLDAPNRCALGAIAASRRWVVVPTTAPHHQDPTGRSPSG